MNLPAQMMLSSKKKKQSHFRSVISDIFDGSILSLVQCLTCDRVRCTAQLVALEGAADQHKWKTFFLLTAVEFTSILTGTFLLDQRSECITGLYNSGNIPRFVPPNSR